MNVKKYYVTLLCMMLMVCGLVFIPSLETNASEVKVADGSYLTKDTSALGKAISQTRGVYLMTGDSAISKAGSNKIYCSGSTTANMTVGYVAVIVYVEQYNSTLGGWSQVACWTASKANNYYVSTSKTLTVDQGYYYRVRAEHFAGPTSGNRDRGNTVSDGIYIPKT